MIRILFFGIFGVFGVFFSCKKERTNKIFILEQADPPLDGYLELHFKNEASGIILSYQHLFTDSTFSIIDNKLFFFNDTFNIENASNNKVILRNSHYYGEFLIKYINVGDALNYDSMFLMNHYLYWFKNVDVEDDSVFIESLTDEFIDFLQKNNSNNWSSNIEELIIR